MTLFFTAGSRIKLALRLAALLCPVALAGAQAAPTASRAVRFAVFGEATGVWTGLDHGRNLGLTVGVNADLPSFGRLRPELEVRGTYPVDDGAVDAQRNIVGGLRLGYALMGRVTPYAFALFGRGRIDYAAPGYRRPGTPFFYTVSSSNVLASGAGLEVRLTRTFSAQAELQVNHQQTPVTDTGTLNSKAVNVGLRWRPRFKRRHGMADAD